MTRHTRQPLTVLTGGDGSGDRLADPWVDGYRRGFTAGREVGYGASEHEQQQVWAELADWVHGITRTPAAAELAARRASLPDRCHEPRPPCGRCSACLWLAAAERNQRYYRQPDYPGGRVMWTAFVVGADPTRWHQRGLPPWPGPATMTRRPA